MNYFLDFLRRSYPFNEYCIKNLFYNYLANRRISIRVFIILSFTLLVNFQQCPSTRQPSRAIFILLDLSYILSVKILKECFKISYFFGRFLKTFSNGQLWSDFTGKNFFWVFVKISGQEWWSIFLILISLHLNSSISHLFIRFCLILIKGL